MVGAEEACCRPTSINESVFPRQWQIMVITMESKRNKMWIKIVL